MFSENGKHDALARLAALGAHVHYIRQMVTDNRSCEDILQQTEALHSAIENLEGVLVRARLDVYEVPGLAAAENHALMMALSNLFPLSHG